MKISYCTSIRDRLAYLKKTLPESINDNVGLDVEFIVSDGGSTDGLQEWVESTLQNEIKAGVVKYFKHESAEHWVHAKEKNRAHSYATGKILCNLDADNAATKDFSLYLLDVFSKDLDSIVYFVGDGAWGGGCGRIALSDEGFHLLGGYDEILSHGWGYEDTDLIYRALEIGLNKRRGSNTLLKFLKHGDDLRIKYTEDKDKLGNNLRTQAKSQINIASGKLIANLEHPLDKQ